MTSYYFKGVKGSKAKLERLFRLDTSGNLSIYRNPHFIYFAPLRFSQDGRLLLVCYSSVHGSLLLFVTF